MINDRLKSEINLVKQVGETIGYGHLMSLASALWRKKLKESGTPESGAFYPAITMFIKDKHLKMVNDEINHYDKIIKENYDK